MVQHLKKHKC